MVFCFIDLAVADESKSKQKAKAIGSAVGKVVGGEFGPIGAAIGSKVGAAVGGVIHDHGPEAMRILGEARQNMDEDGL